MLRKLLPALALAGLLGLAPARAQVTGPFAFLANGLTTTVTTVKAASGRTAWLHCANSNASTAFVQFFDTTGSVTLGTTVPNMSIGIAAGVSDAQVPAQFFNGIKIAATTTVKGNTAPGTALDCSVGFY